MKRRVLLPVYSGPLSKEFWLRIRSLPDPDRGEMYSCGILLQELEARVVSWINAAESRACVQRKRKVGAR